MPAFRSLASSGFQSLYQSMLGLLLLGISASALELGRPFASHMVLPMRKPIPIWGTAAPGSKIELTFRNHLLSTQADQTGNWNLELPAMEASREPSSLTLRGDGAALQLEDLLIGRVFLCSGQSNMDFPLARATGGTTEAKRAAAYSALRLCNLTGAPTDAKPYDEKTFSRLTDSTHFVGTWQTASEASASSFSAVAWWTAVSLIDRDGIPIGLVENAVGGSGTEAWLPRNLIHAEPAYSEFRDQNWLTAPHLSKWAQGRAKLNLGNHHTANHPFRPGFLFESGVRPWCRFPFHGVLWYQGETNAELNDPGWNLRLIEDLVKSWRTELRNPTLPFFMVQLPRIGGNDPLRQYWPHYRETQEQASRALPNLTLIITRDLGWDSPDVHPPDKKPIGLRLASAIPAP